MGKINKTAKDYDKHFHRGKQSTKHKNALRLKDYCLWLKKTPEQLIAEYEQAKKSDDLKAWEREQVNRITEYYNWTLTQISLRTKKQYTINHARNQAIGVLAFYRQNTQQLEDVVKELAPPQMATNEFRFKQDDLRKMFYYGDTEEKALLSLAVSYGQGSKEFLSLECEKLRSIINEAKDKGLDFAHWIGEARSKTSVQPISFLTPEAIESVAEYLELLEKKKHGKLPKYLWCNSKPDKHITNEGLNKKFRRLVAKANIKTYNKKVHFHLIRKFTFSRLRRIDRDMAKIICAKQVSASDMTYEDIEEQCEKVFRLAYKDISLNGDVQGKTKRKQSEEIQKLKQALEHLEGENRSLKTRIDLMQERLEELPQETITKLMKHLEELGLSQNLLKAEKQNSA